MGNIFRSIVISIALFAIAMWSLLVIVDVAIKLVFRLLPVAIIGGIFYLVYRRYQAWTKHKEDMSI